MSEIKRSYKITDIEVVTDLKDFTKKRYIVKADFFEDSKKVHNIKHAFSIKTEEKEIEHTIAKACKVWFDDKANAKIEKETEELLKQANIKKNNLIGKGGTL